MTVADATQTESLESGYAPINGLRMYYEIRGAGKPLVYIHPRFGRAGMNTFPLLTKSRRLIAFDLHGHGRTADIGRPFTLEQDADDVAALMHHLGIRRADIFGESFGGAIAVLLAVRHPQLVERVATYGSVLSRVEGAFAPDTLAELMRLTFEHESVRFLRESYEKVAPHPERWPALFAKATRVPWNGLTKEQLRSIAVPVLIAAGDHDMLGPRLEHMLEMARSIPHAQLAIVPDAGHFVFTDEPDKVVPMLLRFFDRPMSGVPFATPQTGFHPGKTR
jgi:pimeloyl-ACP methyl ester carboxylesterase